MLVNSGNMNLIEIGHTTGAHGVSGWIKIKPYFSEGRLLLRTKIFWLNKQEFEKPVSIRCLKAKDHGSSVLVLLEGIKNRDEAELIRGSTVFLPRSCLPALPNDEFYWVDLIGLKVNNLIGEDLGVVIDLMDNGAHPILKILSSTPVGLGKKLPALLIPFVRRFIKIVDQNRERKITVDWDSSW